MIHFSRRVNRAFFVLIRHLRSDGDDSGENLPLPPAFDPEVAAEMSFPLLLLAAGCCGGAGGGGGCGGCRGLNM